MSVAVDAGGSGSGDLTFSHTVSGSDRYLVVGVVGTSPDTFEVAGITYNGAPMMRLHRNVNADDTIWADLWGLVAPDTGTHSVVVTTQGSGGVATGAISFTGVDQDVSFGGVGGSGGGGDTMSVGPPLAGVSGGMMAAVLGAGGNQTVSTGTEAWNDGSGDAMATLAADGSYQTISWTSGGAEWAIGAVMLRPVGAPHDNEYGNRRSR